MTITTMTFDIEAAVQHARTNAASKSTKYCARYTANAIDAGLSAKSDVERPRHAYQFGAYLEANGFVAIPAPETFLKGDVVIIDKFASWSGPHKDAKKAFTMLTNPSGHMAIYDGTQWISDFKQRELYPGPDYRYVRPNFTIYRHPSATAGPK